MQQPVAFFDIDGTFIRSSLLIEVVRALVKCEVLPKITLEWIREHEVAWQDRSGPYLTYILSVVQEFLDRIKDCRKRDLEFVGRMVAREQQNRVYVYTRSLIAQLRLTHRLVVITGSPEEVVLPFTGLWKLDHVHAAVLEVIDGRCTGRRTQSPAEDKRAFVDRILSDPEVTLVGSVGVGDTESDVAFLERVEQPIAFNPNAELLAIARARGWPFVIERKDTRILHHSDGRYEVLP